MNRFLLALVLAVTVGAVVKASTAVYSPTASGGSSGVSVFARVATAVAVTTTTTETTIYTGTVPANTLGTNKALRVTMYGAGSNTINVATTIRFTYGGTTQSLTFGGASVSWASFKSQHVLAARDSASSQSANSEARGNGNTTYVSSAFPMNTGILSIDSTADQTLSLTLQTANNVPTITVYSVLIELLP